MKTTKICFLSSVFRLLSICLLSSVFCLLLSGEARANNVAVSGVVLQNRELGAGTVEVKFTLTQDNTFSGQDANANTFYDCIWVFVKYWVVGEDSQDTGWHHATLVSGGTVTPTSDGKGAFCSVGADQVLKWSYVTDDVTGTDTVKVKVNAIEMVYIPGGEFIYNAGAIGGSDFNNFGAGSQVTVDAAGDIPGGAAAGWPNGFGAFYIMKYEVSQGQYADYLNMLSVSAATSRYTGSYGSNRQSVSYASGNDYGLRYAADSASRAQNYTSWDDVRAYISWCGLRPMTEMEFEKAARGGGSGNTNTYPWGNTTPTTTTYTFDGTTISEYYACYNNTSAGPTDVGHYLSGDIARTNEQTGASIYGVTDLGGSLWEHLINCAHSQVPENGSGTVTWPASWPDAASGKGLRGGGWYFDSSGLQVSGREYAGRADAGRGHNYGVRAARTP